MESIVHLDGATKVFRTGEVEVHALAGVSLEVPSGDFVAIMGPSGSGKSTLLNVLGCLTPLTDGTYRLAGEDVSRASRNRLAEIRNRRVGFVFQQFNLLPRLDAAANVDVPMVYAGIPIAERRTRAGRLLESVGLASRTRHLPSQLSGGEQQRVAIARALTNRPAILLADEPTGNLDSESGREVMEIFRRLNEAEGVTILMVTHNDESARYAKRVVRMKDGRPIAP